MRLVGNRNEPGATSRFLPGFSQVFSADAPRDGTALGLGPDELGKLRPRQFGAAYAAFGGFHQLGQF